MPGRNVPRQQAIAGGEPIHFGDARCNIEFRIKQLNAQSLFVAHFHEFMEQFHKKRIDKRWDAKLSEFVYGGVYARLYKERGVWNRDKLSLFGPTMEEYGIRWSFNQPTGDPDPSRWLPIQTQLDLKPWGHNVHNDHIFDFEWFSENQLAKFDTTEQIGKMQSSLLTLGDRVQAYNDALDSYKNALSMLAPVSNVIFAR